MSDGPIEYPDDTSPMIVHKLKDLNDIEKLNIIKEGDA